MPQPSTDYNPNNSFSLMLIGPPFSGKTNAALTFPNPYILDADDKMGNGVVRLPKDKKFWFDRVLVDDKGGAVTPELRWTRATECLKAACAMPEIETIIVDSGTAMSTFLQDHILHAGGSKLVVAGVKSMDMQCWGPFQTLMTRLIMMLKASGKKFIWICHEELEKDEVTGSFRYTPLVQGALRHKMAGMFTNVWRCETKSGLGKDNKMETTYIVRTQPKAQMTLGNSLGLPAEFTLSWDELSKLMPGATKQQTT